MRYANKLTVVDIQPTGESGELHEIPKQGL